jgi:6-phosphogluconolactonase (cycloisomerase 2 family)
MFRKLDYAACLCAGLCALATCACAQSTDLTASPDATTTATPVAYVYVSYAPDIKSSNAYKIYGYKAWADGTMTVLPQSPFNDNVGYMAVNGKYLMAGSNDSTYIEAYQIESGGVLQYVNRTEYAHFNGANDCGSATQIFFDHTGADLYVDELNSTSACTNSEVASFSVNQSSGALNYLGYTNTGSDPGLNIAPSFIGNNVYALAANNDHCSYWTVFGFKRGSNGYLTQSGGKLINDATPPSGVRLYIPSLAAADPTNHVAFTMQRATPPVCDSGPLQMVSFSVDANGNLSTTNTYSNMPATLVTTPYDLKMSPSGKLLAIAGQQGLQIFGFNGAGPMTHYTNLLTTEPINQMFWDNANHLYAISQSDAKVYAWTITPSGWSAAPGSPHALPAPFALIVQPK